MTKRLQHLAPLQLGIVLATLYGAISLIFVPILILIALLAPKSEGGVPFAGGIVFIIMIPVLYAAVGFIGGLLTAVIYNVIAKWSGGIEFTLADVPPR